MSSFFDRMYEETPPWETGSPQPSIAALVAEGVVRGRVLDIGCGTGENALLVASRGLDVVGIDGASRAIDAARAKASERGIEVRFLVGDALGLPALGGRFDTVIDSGLFHTFSDDARVAYLRSLSSVLVPGASLFVLCFSDSEPNWGGPRRVTRDDLLRTFRTPFAVERIDEARYANRLSQEGAAAWLARVVYIGRALSSDN
jgi:SAM-dependent methyltransferase